MSLLPSRFWIRKDREEYLLAGAMVAALAATYVSAHWHFTDRLDAIKSIKPIERAAKTQGKKIREVEYTRGKPKAGNTQYYRMDEDSAPSVPRLQDSGKEAAGPQ